MATAKGKNKGGKAFASLPSAVPISSTKLLEGALGD